MKYLPRALVNSSNVSLIELPKAINFWLYPCSFWDILPRISSTHSSVLFSEMGNIFVGCTQDCFFFDPPSFIEKLPIDYTLYPSFLLKIKESIYGRIFFLKLHCIQICKIRSAEQILQMTVGHHLHGLKCLLLKRRDIERMVGKKYLMDHELTTNASRKWWVGYFASSPTNHYCKKTPASSRQLNQLRCCKQSKVFATQLPVDHMALTYFDYFFVIQTNI